MSERTGEMERSHKFRELPPLNKESNKEAARLPIMTSDEACLPPPRAPKSAK